MAFLKGTDKQNQRFRPKNKLKNTEDFKRVYQKGQRIYSKWATLVLLPNSLGYPRLGISAGRKKLGKAIYRNKAKRRARELFRKNKQLLGSFDLIMILKSPIITMAWCDLENSYKKILLQISRNKNEKK